MFDFKITGTSMTFEAEVERVAAEQRFSSNMYKPEEKICALFRS